MLSNSQSQSGRFDPRIMAALGFCSVGAALAVLRLAGTTDQLALRFNMRQGDVVVPSQFLDDVSNLPQTIREAQRKSFVRPLELEPPPIGTKQLLPGATSAAPSTVATGPAAPMPGPLSTFDGMNFNANGAGHPPDPVGDVGPAHYVQAVNISVGIYDKATSAALATFTFNDLWANAGTGTSCDTFHGGDPTVIYVPQYDRFIVADFSWSNIQSGPYYECVAVSQTSDPVAGGWWFYPIRTDDAAHPWFADYPKMGIWPDGLYMTANMFLCKNSSCSSSTYEDARAFAFNISDLVNGAPLRSVIVDPDSSRFSLLPSNYRGVPPPAGSPNYMVAESRSYRAWEV